MNLTPLEDGVSHINVYSKGKTQLGRWLTNPSPLGFHHPVHGRFRSVEGFHYFLKNGTKDKSYAELNGFEARRKGIAEKYLNQKNPDFDRLMRSAWLCKITQHQCLYELVLANELPLAHYYYYGNEDNCKIIIDKSNFVDNLSSVCMFLKGC